MNRTLDTSAAPKAAKSRDLVVVDAAHQDAVELDGVEPGGHRGVHPGKNLGERVASRDGGKTVGLERIARDIDSAQAGPGQIGGLMR